MWWKCLPILFALLFSIACTPSQTNLGSDNNKEDQMIPKQQIDNTNYGEELLYSAAGRGQINVDQEMRIGVGEIQQGQYEDADGNQEKGPIAHLSFFLGDNSLLEHDETVYEGKILFVKNYRVRVTDMNINNNLIVIKIAKQITE